MNASPGPSSDSDAPGSYDSCRLVRTSSKSFSRSALIATAATANSGSRQPGAGNDAMT